MISNSRNDMQKHNPGANGYTKEKAKRKEDGDERSKTGTAGEDGTGRCMGSKPTGKERKQVEERIRKRSGGRRAGKRVSGSSRAGGTQESEIPLVSGIWNLLVSK